MSLFTQTSSLLSLKPRVWVEGGNLMARTGWLVRFLSLFSYSKLVAVDKSTQYVTITTKRLWGFTSSKVIPFGRIERIDYSFGSMMTDWSLFQGETDRLESFTISLMLDDPHEKVKLFSFMGEGSVSTGWSGVLFGGDDVVDYQGDQEASSRDYAEALKAFTGKTLT